jgi:hypothetical protein
MRWLAVLAVALLGVVGISGNAEAAARPVATTIQANTISATSAKLWGAVSPQGLSTSAWFQYGKSNFLGSSTSARSVGSTNALLAVSQTVTLEPDTTYYFRVVARNSRGTSYGALESFKTSVGAEPTPTPTVPTPSPTSTTPTPSPTTPTPTGSYDCVQPLGSNCGGYKYAGIPNSNGYNTYVSNQAVGPQSGTTETIYVNNPGDWKMVADARPYGYTGVQTFPDVQQLFNNWCGNVTNWSACASPDDTPVNALNSLKINYAEVSPHGTNDLYQFSPDLWLSNYGSDIMFWVDVKGRCNEGAFGGTVLGHATIAGQNWTVHRYGGAGAEIIFVLDGPGGSGTCATQSSGTIDIKAGVDWLVAGGFVLANPSVTQLNTGWEITSAENATFQMTQYSITVS